MSEEQHEARVQQLKALHNALHPDKAITADMYPNFIFEWRKWPVWVLEGRIKIYEERLAEKQNETAHY